MSTLKVSAIAHPSAASTAFTLNSDGSVTAGPSVNLGVFPAGTAMLFVQTSAPTGWTKSTTHNDKALRVVSGAASSGGTTAFTSVFANRTPSGTVGSTTLSTAQMPSHSHTIARSTDLNNSSDTCLATTGVSGVVTTSAAGGGGSHNHSFTGTALDFAVQYVDVIIATKN